MGQRAGKPLSPPEFLLVPRPMSLRLDTWEKSKCLQSGNIKCGTLLGMNESRTCAVGIWKAGRQKCQGGSEVEAHPVVKESLKGVTVRDSYSSPARSPGVGDDKIMGRSGNRTEFEPPLPFSLPS